MKREPSLIEVDDPTTWPEEVVAWATEQSESSEVALMEQEPVLRDLLAKRPVGGYHCTRLLDHELGAIQKEGLRRLSQGLIEGRLRAAREAGALTIEQHDRLAARTVFGSRSARDREGQVCAILGRAALSADPGGCVPLLSTWGGEGIYWANRETEPVLGRIGRPTVVVCALDLSDANTAWTYSLGAVFVSTARGEPTSADVFYRADVPAEDVLDLWQPGRSEYDRHRALPR